MINLSNLPPALMTQYHMKLLSREYPGCIHAIPAKKILMESNNGTDQKFRRYHNLPLAKTPISQSAKTPPGVNQGYTDITVKAQMYGQWQGVTEQALLANQDRVLNELVNSLGISRRLTEDSLMKDMLRSTASTIYAVNGVNGQNPTEITADDVNVIYKALHMANGKSMATEIQAGPAIGTAPVRSSYWAMGSSQLIGQLDRCDNFRHVSNYPDPKTLPDEYGAVGGLRFLLSSEGAVNPGASSTGQDIMEIFVTASEGYAQIAQDGFSTKLVFGNAKYTGPLALYHTVGWKMLNAFRVLNDKWVIKFCVTLA